MNIERISFIDSRLAEELKPVSKLLQNIDRAVLRKYLKVLVQSLEGNKITEKEYSVLFCDAANEEKAKLLYTGLYRLLKYALRNQSKSLKQEVFKEDLKELGFPEECVNDISGVLYGSRRPQLLQSLIVSKPRLPVIASFRWRLDVAISTSVLNRVLEPSLFVEIVLNSGECYRFEVPISKFHYLRCGIARLLKEMEDLEKRSVLSIQE